MAKTEKGYGRNTATVEPACEHTDRPRYANGLCTKCYHSQWMAANYRRLRSTKPADYYIKAGLARFGLTPDAYAALLAKQGGVCKICRRPRGKRRLAIDHNHATGAIRGLLCGPCNTLLSHVEHASEFSRLALCYLEEYSNA